MKEITLAEYLGLERPCGGLGLCGNCRVDASRLALPLSEPSETERRSLGDELERGIRLACQAQVKNAELPSKSEEKQVKSSEIRRGVAIIDIGTTTLEAKLLTDSGELALKPRLNPQRLYGADVITRIGAAREHSSELTSSLRAELRAMLAGCDVTRAVVTGNTVMLHFLCGLDVSGMACDPFTPASLFGITASGRELGLGFDGEVYLPSCSSAFVGADTTCAVLAAKPKSDENLLLVDLGTNGELALSRHGVVTACSTAAGPALEGADISCGMRAEPGAISRVKFANGRLELEVIGDCTPRGICGSGLIAATAALLDAGILGSDGNLTEPVELAPDVTLTPEDMRALRLAKSAIRTGIDLLTRGERVDRLCLAGNFGRGLDLRGCVRIGLIPDGIRVEILGNAALEGARLIANGALEPARFEYVPLVDDAEFFDRFCENLLFDA